MNLKSVVGIWALVIGVFCTTSFAKSSRVAKSPCVRGREFTIAVVGQGFDYSHQTLRDHVRLDLAIDLINPSERGFSRNKMETMAAELITGRESKDACKPNNVKLVPVRIFSSTSDYFNQSLFRERLIEGIRQLIQKPIDGVYLNLDLSAVKAAIRDQAEKGAARSQYTKILKDAVALLGNQAVVIPAGDYGEPTNLSEYLTNLKLGNKHVLVGVAQSPLGSGFGKGVLMADGRNFSTTIQMVTRAGTILKPSPTTSLGAAVAMWKLIQNNMNVAALKNQGVLKH